MFFVLKNMENTENTKSREQEKCSENTKMVFSVFSKIVYKNNFQKQEPKRPISSWLRVVRGCLMFHIIKFTGLGPRIKSGNW